MNFENLKKRLHDHVSYWTPDSYVPIDDVEEAVDAIEQLQRENERLRTRLEVDPRHSYDGIDCRDTTIRELERELEEARRDAVLFTWWFSDSNKGNFLLRYMEGMKDRWSVERWRTEINAARQQKG